MRRPSNFASVLLASVCVASLSSFASAQETPDAPDDEARQQTVVVRGQFIPNEVRNTSEVAALIDDEDFTLAGDSDAAAALARVAV